ncbi:MAG: hypothetical protein HUU10_13530 [Bacteroidetes bacterium]|nr:hypothetical protein [Bacteroidota bacterium]
MLLVSAFTFFIRPDTAWTQPMTKETFDQVVDYVNTELLIFYIRTLERREKNPIDQLKGLEENTIEKPVPYRRLLDFVTEKGFDNTAINIVLTINKRKNLFSTNQGKKVLIERILDDQDLPPFIQNNGALRLITLRDALFEHFKVPVPKANTQGTTWEQRLELVERGLQRTRQTNQVWWAVRNDFNLITLVSAVFLSILFTTWYFRYKTRRTFRELRSRLRVLENNMIVLSGEPGKIRRASETATEPDTEPGKEKATSRS